MQASSGMANKSKMLEQSTMLKVINKVLNHQAAYRKTHQYYILSCAILSLAGITAAVIAAATNECLCEGGLATLCIALVVGVPGLFSPLIAWLWKVVDNTIRQILYDQ